MKTESFMSKDKDKNEFYKIEVYYTKGGMNFFTGKVERRGIYFGFSVVEKIDGWEKTTPMHETSFKILFKQLTRSSKKQLEIASKFLEDNEEKLFNLFKVLDKGTIFEFVSSHGSVA